MWEFVPDDESDEITLAKVRAAEKCLVEARQDRDFIIQAAHYKKIRLADIATAANLSVARIRQISPRRPKTKPTSPVSELFGWQVQVAEPTVLVLIRGIARAAAHLRRRQCEQDDSSEDRNPHTKNLELVSLLDFIVTARWGSNPVEAMPRVLEDFVLKAEGFDRDAGTSDYCAWIDYELRNSRQYGEAPYSAAAGSLEEATGCFR